MRQTDMLTDDVHATIGAFVAARIADAQALYTALSLFASLDPEQAQRFLVEVDAGRPTHEPDMQAAPFLGDVPQTYLERVQTFEVMRWAVNQRAAGLPVWPSAA